MATQTNTNVEPMPNTVPVGTVGSNIQWVGVWSDISKTTFLMRIDVTDVNGLVLGSTVRIPAGMITFTYTPAATETNGLARRALDGIIEGGVGITMHSGDPGSDGTANELTGLGVGSIAENEWTYSN